MKKFFLLQLFFVALGVHGNIYWQRQISNYNRHEYMAANQNWQVSQGVNGWIYFANNKGLLEFDGVYWNTYSFGQNQKARAVRAEGNDIYVGGLGEFGRFSPNPSGKLVYQCLSESYHEKRNLNVWNIHRMGNSIYFQGDDAVYVHGDKSMKIQCPLSIHFSATINNRLLVATKDGLYLLGGGKFRRMPGTEEMTRSNVVGMFPYLDKVVVVTAENGIYMYDYNNVSPLHTAADPLLSGKSLSSAAISGSLLALGTVQDGLILVDLNGNYVNHISMSKGLQGKSVLSMSFDRDRNLWVGLDNGIVFLPLGSPLFFLSGNMSYIGSGYSSCEHDGKMYFGTNQGVYYAPLPMKPNNEIETTLVPGSEGLSLCLKTYDGRLFCGGRNYFFMIDKGGSKTSFDLRGVWNVVPMGVRKDVLLLGTYWGLYVMKKEGDTWKLSHKVADCDLSAKTMYVEDGSHNVWVANKLKGIYRLTLSADLKRVVNSKNYNSKELPAGENVTINKVDGEIVVASRYGLFRYDIAEDELTEHAALEKLTDGKDAYTYFWQDGEKNLWYVHDNMLRLLRYNRRTGGYDKNGGETFLYDNFVEDFENVSISDNKAIIGTEDGFAMLLYKSPHYKVKPPKVMIRKVLISGDSLLYAGSTVNTGDCPRISYSHNSVRLEYSANIYDKSQTVLYAYRLEGSGNEEWSDYSPEHVKEYTNLREGHYKFHVKILSGGKQQSSVATFEFDVLPPWYRTWWAYLLYVVLLGAVGYYVYRRIMEKNRLLIEQKEHQMEELEQHYKTEAELKEQNELIRTRMNVIRKNEMLMEIKKTAQSINNSLAEDNLSSIKRKVVRLIGQINTNIDHDDDLESFQGSFDAVHHNFFALLEKKYPELTYKDKILCAYLKMNLLSKEIAPLMNISVRGVEISRYRLRKKLHLDERANLATFMQHITDDAQQQ